MLGLGWEEVAGASFESGCYPAFSAWALFWNFHMHSGFCWGCYIPVSLGQHLHPAWQAGSALWVAHRSQTPSLEPTVPYSPSYS